VRSELRGTAAQRGSQVAEPTACSLRVRPVGRVLERRIIARWCGLPSTVSRRVFGSGLGMFFQTVKMIWWMMIRRCGPGREPGAGVAGVVIQCVCNLG
jgi:hypothetical protein